MRRRDEFEVFRTRPRPGNEGELFYGNQDH